MKRIPTSFNEFTVSQFIEWHKITQQRFENVEDREFALLALVLGITTDQAMSIPNRYVLPMLAKLNTLALTKPNEKIKKMIIVNGKVYEAILKPSELKDMLSTSQYTAFKQYTQKDCIENMHLILPLMYCPFKFFKRKG